MQTIDLEIFNPPKDAFVLEISEDWENAKNRKLPYLNIAAFMSDPSHVLAHVPDNADTLYLYGPPLFTWQTPIPQFMVNKAMLEAIILLAPNKVYADMQFGIGIAVASTTHLLNIPCKLYANSDMIMFGMSGEKYELTPMLVESIIETQTAILKAATQ